MNKTTNLLSKETGNLRAMNLLSVTTNYNTNHQSIQQKDFSKKSQKNKNFHSLRSLIKSTSTTQVDLDGASSNNRTKLLLSKILKRKWVATNLLRKILLSYRPDN